MALEFNQRAVQMARLSAIDLLEAVPELRGISIVFDWGERNHSEVMAFFTGHDRKTNQLTADEAYWHMSQLSRLQQLLLNQLTHHITEQGAKLAEQANQASATSAGKAVAGPADTPANPGQ